MADRMMREEPGLLYRPRPGRKAAAPASRGALGFSLAEAGDFVDANILEIRLDAVGRTRKRWVTVRPVPAAEGWFETVWDDARNDRIVVEQE